MAEEEIKKGQEKEAEKFEAFDVDGNPIEGLLSLEESSALNTSLEENKEKLTKLENKDFNFRKLESMTEEEKNKLTAVELSLKKQQEELEEKQKSFETGFVTDVKKDLLDSLVGDDEELRKKVELNYARIKDSETAKTREEIKNVLSDALSMSVGVKTNNPLNRAINGSGNAPAGSSKPSSDLIKLGKMFGLSDEDLKDVK